MTSFGKILEETVDVVLEHKLTLLRVTLVPIVLGIALSWTPLYLTETYQFILYNIIDAVIWALLAISVHRVILLGPTATGLLGNLRLQSRELMYIGYGFLIGLMMSPIVFFIGLLPIFGFILGMIVALVLWSRLSIVLPAVAVDKEFGLTKAWNATSGYSLTCFGTVVFIPVLTMLPLLILMPDFPGVVASILSTAYTMIIMIFNIGLLSTTYKKLVANDEVEEDKIEL